MKIKALVEFETFLRALRDNLIIRPLARSHLIQRYVHSNFDLVVRTFDDHKIAFDPQDRVVGHHVGKFGDWFRNDFQRVVSLINRAGRSTQNKFFLDVGANIGTQTVYALIANDFERAIAIEPSPKNLMAIKANLAINDLAHRATIIPKAAGDAAGKMKLMMSGQNSGAHSLRRDHGDGIIVEVTTIDDILADLSVDPSEIGLLWLDVEGYEPEAIFGAARLIATRVPICVEFNSEIYGIEGSASLLRKIKSAGYSSATSIGYKLPEKTFTLDAIDPIYLEGDLLFL